MYISTELCTYRAFDECDIDHMLEMANCEELHYFTLPYAFPRSRKWLQARFIPEPGPEPPSRVEMAIVRNTDSRLIGAIDIFDIEYIHGRASVGVVLWRPEDRRQGIGSDALRLATDTAFKKLRLRRLQATIFADNEVSLALFKKHGFEEEGVLRGYFLRNGEFVDTVLLSLVRPQSGVTCSS